GIDHDLIAAVVRRSDRPDQLAVRYRGCLGIDEGGARAIDRLVLSEIGWGWLDRGRVTRRLGNGRFEVVGTDPEGEVVVWTGVATDGLPSSCPPDDLETGREPSWVVLAYRRDAHTRHDVA